MKSRLSLIFAALVVLLGSMVWIIQDRRSAVTPPAMAAAPSDAIRVTAAPEPIIAPVISTAPVAPIPVATAVPQTQSPPIVHVGTSGDVQYTARDGDTVSQLAIALLGTDSKEHRDAIVEANRTLQSNPDRVLAGQTYSVAPSSTVAAVPAEEKTNASSVSRREAASASDQPVAGNSTTDAARAIDNAPKMRYVAQTGDTVAGLASNLLGADTTVNRTSIIAGNASLEQDPNHLVAGKSYTIAAPNGLAANPAASQARAATTQPDADDVLVAAGRHLRYTAKPGDTVSKMAMALLGSDTAANRDVIVNSNPSLKQDPDHLVAGQAYWVAAPTGDATP